MSSDFDCSFKAKKRAKKNSDSFKKMEVSRWKMEEKLIANNFGIKLKNITFNN